MVSSTRKTKLVPPSGMAAKMLKFAKSKTINPYFSAWIEIGGDKLYVRKGADGRFHLANWQFKTKSKGHATRILDYFETLVKTDDFPFKGLKIESVGNARFAAFLRKREGWVEKGGLFYVPDFVYDA
jgi:hypothetical protein